MSCGWVCSLVEHWLFGLFGPVRDVSTAPAGGGFREVIAGWSVGRAHCWVLRERAPGSVVVVVRRFGWCLPGWWASAGRAGRSGRHTALVVFWWSSLLVGGGAGGGWWSGGGGGVCSFVF